MTFEQLVLLGNYIIDIGYGPTEVIYCGKLEDYPDILLFKTNKGIVMHVNKEDLEKVNIKFIM